MRATFFSYDDAMNFATENNCQNINEIKKAENIRVSCAYSLNSEVLKPFCIDEFTEIVPCYIFSEQETYNREKGDYENFWYIDNCILLLKNIITGDLFHIYQTKYNSQKFGLSLFYPSVKEHLNYFKTDLEQPNYIGKPNRKKLQAWFDYLIGVDREKLDYVNRAKCAINAFAEKVLAKFPDAIIDRASNGIVKRIRATWGAIRFIWTPTETGKFYREAYIYTAPSDEELLK